MFTLVNHLFLAFNICFLLLIVFNIALANEPVKKSNPGEQAIIEANKTINNIDTVTLQKRLKENPNIDMVGVREVNDIEFIGAYIDANESVNLTRGWLAFDIDTHVNRMQEEYIEAWNLNKYRSFALL